MKFFESRKFKIDLGCIEYRKKILCSGDSLAKIDLPLSRSDLGYQSEDRSGYCASYCLGIAGSVSFNWYQEGTVGQCKCLRSISKLTHIKDLTVLTSKRLLYMIKNKVEVWHERCQFKISLALASKNSIVAICHWQVLEISLID